MNVDVQIQFFEDSFAACLESEETTIATMIQAALNDNFATTVADWQGAASFGTFSLDLDQEVNNVGPFARRKLQKRLTSTAGSLAQLASPPRNLQTATCPSSRAFVDCTADYCRWGCVTASTTNCGTPSLANWGNLAQGVRTRLAALGYGCLGLADQLEVVVVVDDPAARRFAPIEVPKAAPAAPIKLLNHLVKGNPTKGVANNVTGTATATARAIRTGGPIHSIDLASFDASTVTADESIETLPVASRLVFTFFPGKGRQPTTTEIDALVQATKAYFSQVFRNHPQFSTAFSDFTMTKITPIYSPQTNPDQFAMEFLALVLVDKASNTQTGNRALKVMSNSSWKDYIRKYVSQSASGPVQWNEFYETSVVHFKGASHA